MFFFCFNNNITDTKFSRRLIQQKRYTFFISYKKFSALPFYNLITDSILIILGVNGLGQLWESNLVLQKLANWGGILFLSCYGIKSFLSAFKNKDMVIYNETDYQSLKYVILVAFSVSFLNPHGFLDTCVFMSSIASNFSEELRPSFTIGAISASFIWFTVLGFGARYLRKLFEKQIAWKILDIVIGCMMFAIVLSLLIKII